MSRRMSPTLSRGCLSPFKWEATAVTVPRADSLVRALCLERGALRSRVQKPAHTSGTTTFRDARLSGISIGTSHSTYLVRALGAELLVGALTFL